MKKIFILSLFSLLLFSGCNDLDIAPKNLITDKDLIGSESGMDIYMARMYSNMPFEDFKYMAKWGFDFNSWLGAFGIEGTGEAVGRDNICKSFTGEDTQYWGKSFPLLRDANFLIENLPKYEGNFAGNVYNHYMGEAYFVRAFVFYTMAKRYGGVPLVTRVIQYPADESTLEVPRSSEKETWNQVLSDFDTAISLLSNKPLKDGYSSKYIALAFKSEAMLYAGSVAKYNETVQGRLTGLGRKTGVRVIGFDESQWEDASKKYFTEAYKAAREVMINGGYDLYKKKWAANDKEAQYQNMVDMFEMADGRAIKDAGADYDDQNPYVNRDPRFYYDILYNGVKWGNNKGVPHYFELWEYNTYDNSKSADMMALFSQTYNPRCPYLIRKWWPETANKWENDYNYYMPAIYIRVAQLYLDFAEAANEAYGPETKVPGTDMSAVDAINIIRNRVGAVPVRNEYKANKEIFRERIRNERAVELCFEDHRWYDIRRWRIAKDAVKVIYKAVITRTGKDQFRFEYMEHPDYKRVFEDKHYWYPIPKSQMEMLNNVEQNPGW